MILKYEITVNGSLHKVDFKKGNYATTKYLKRIKDEGKEEFKRFNNVSFGETYHLGEAEPYKVYFKFYNNNNDFIVHTYELIEKGN